MIGDVALILKRQYERAVAINEFMIRTSEADLITLGFSQGEVTTIKLAFADLAYQKIQSFDSSQHVKQLYGLG